MKIKDLPPTTHLGTVVFSHPDTGDPCVWISQWNKGVWYRTWSETQAGSQVIHPLTLEEGLQAAADFKVVAQSFAEMSHKKSSGSRVSRKKKEKQSRTSKKIPRG